MRKELGLNQRELAKSLNTSVSVISRYERDEMIPSVDTAKKIAEILGSTVGYLLGETEKANLFKDPEMLQRLAELENMQNEDKIHILYVLDSFIKSVKLKRLLYDNL